MSPIEIMALIVAIISIIKVLVIVYKPMAWYKSVVVPIYKNAGITTLVGLIVAAGALYYLLMELNIIQIFAVLFFIMALMAMKFAVYPKDTLDFAKKIYMRKNMLQKYWLSFLIWLVLLAWLLYVMFV